MTIIFIMTSHSPILPAYVAQAHDDLWPNDALGVLHCYQSSQQCSHLQVRRTGEPGGTHSSRGFKVVTHLEAQGFDRVAWGH